MNNAALLATAAAKALAHAGLSEALEYGTTRVLRINGLDHIYADSFVVTADVNGGVHCNGYAVSSTCRDLAYDIIRTNWEH
jgi:hypothetical protein